MISGTKQPDKDPDDPIQRSMIGIREDGVIIFLAAESGVALNSGQGRRGGLPIPVAEEWLRRMGAVNILNLDGGGSTQFRYDGETKTLPGLSGGFFRPVGSVFLVHENQD